MPLRNAGGSPMNHPIVTAVIPTHGRPGLVRRAVDSALAQTLAEIEVIVVIDGWDEATRVALSAIADERLRVIALPVKVGGSEARNTGVRAARAAAPSPASGRSADPCPPESWPSIFY